MRFIKISIFLNLLFVLLIYLPTSLLGQDAEFEKATKIIQKQKNKILAEQKKSKELAELLNQKEQDLSSVENNVELLQSELFKLHASIEELFLDKQLWHICAKSQNDIISDRHQKLELNNKKLLELVKRLQGEKRELKKECQGYAVYNHQLSLQQRPHFDEESILLLNQELLKSQEEISRLKELFSNLQKSYIKDLQELFSSGIEEKVRLEEIIESQEYPMKDSLSKYEKLCENLLSFKDVSSKAHKTQHQTILKLQKRIKSLVAKVKQREDELKNKSDYFDLKNKEMSIDARRLSFEDKKNAAGKEISALQNKYQTLLQSLGWKDKKIKQLIKANKRTSEKLSVASENVTTLQDDLEETELKYLSQIKELQGDLVEIENQLNSKHARLHEHFIKQEEQLIELRKAHHICCHEKELLNFELENKCNEQSVNYNKINDQHLRLRQELKIKLDKILELEELIKIQESLIAEKSQPSIKESDLLLSIEELKIKLNDCEKNYLEMSKQLEDEKNLNVEIALLFEQNNQELETEINYYLNEYESVLNSKNIAEEELEKYKNKLEKANQLSNSQYHEISIIEQELSLLKNSLIHLHKSSNKSEEAQSKKINNHKVKIQSMIMQLKNSIEKTETIINEKDRLFEELKRLQRNFKRLDQNLENIKTETTIKLAKKKHKIAKLKSLITKKDIKLDDSDKNIDFAKSQISRLADETKSLISKNNASNGMLKKISLDRDNILSFSNQKTAALKKASSELETQIRLAEKLKCKTKSCLLNVGLLDDKYNLDKNGLFSLWASKEIMKMPVSLLIENKLPQSLVGKEFKQFLIGDNFNKMVLNLLPSPDSISKIVKNKSFQENATSSEIIELASMRATEMNGLSTAYKLLLGKKAVMRNDENFYSEVDNKHLWQKLIQVSAGYLDCPSIKKTSIKEIAGNNELLSSLAKLYL